MNEYKLTENGVYHYETGMYIPNAYMLWRNGDRITPFTYNREI